MNSAHPHRATGNGISGFKTPVINTSAGADATLADESEVFRNGRALVGGPEPSPSPAVKLEVAPLATGGSLLPSAPPTEAAQRDNSGLQ